MKFIVAVQPAIPFTLICFASFVYGGFVAGAALAADLPRDAIIARFDALQNFTAAYQIRTDHDPDSYLISQGDAKRVEFGSGIFSFLNGVVKSETFVDDRTLSYWSAKGLSIVGHQIITVSANGRQDELSEEQRGANTTISMGGISSFKAFPPDWTLDVALGLRLNGESEWLTRERIIKAREIPSADANLVILEVDTQFGPVELRFDRHYFYALVFYRSPTGGGTFTEISNSDFHREGNVFLPRHIERRTIQSKDSLGKLRYPMVWTLNVQKYILNDPDNIASRFQVVFPGKLEIYDARTEQPLDIGPTSRPLSDDDIREILAQKDTSRKQSENEAQQRINQVLGGAQPTTAPSNIANNP